MCCLSSMLSNAAEIEGTDRLASLVNSSTEGGLSTFRSEDMKIMLSCETGQHSCGELSMQPLSTLLTAGRNQIKQMR